MERLCEKRTRERVCYPQLLVGDVNVRRKHTVHRANIVHVLLVVEVMLSHQLQKRFVCCDVDRYNRVRVQVVQADSQMRSSKIKCIILKCVCFMPSTRHFECQKTRITIMCFAVFTAACLVI